MVGPGGELLPENDGVRVVCVGVHLYGFAALEGTGRDQALVGSEDGEKVSAFACLAREDEVDVLGNLFQPFVWACRVGPLIGEPHHLAGK